MIYFSYKELPEFQSLSPVERVNIWNRFLATEAARTEISPRWIYAPLIFFTVFGLFLGYVIGGERLANISGTIGMGFGFWVWYVWRLNRLYRKFHEQSELWLSIVK
jgi:hypothetical protein